MEGVCIKCGSTDLKLKSPSQTRKDGTRTYDCRQCSNKSGRKYYHSDLEKQKKRREKSVNRLKNSSLKRFYDITLEEFNVLLAAQNNRCAICNLQETAVHSKSKEIRHLAVDHCHKTGKVRGLLCSRCNLALGKFKDSEELLTTAIKYLKDSL